MSIQSALKSLQSAGVLFPYRPYNTRRPARRRLFLTARAEKDRTDPNSAANILCHKGLIHATLDRWVLGDRIYGDRKARFLTDLRPPPPEVWEIRVVEPKAQQARLLGRFAEPDTLVLTAFHTRHYLGDMGSQAWQDAMNDCVTQWDSFTPALPVFSGKTIEEYVNDNCDKFDIKLPSARGTNAGKARSG